MSIAMPFDNRTPALQKRQQLAQFLSQQGQGQNGAGRAGGMRGVMGGSYFSPRSAAEAQQTQPYFQNPGITQALGVVNAANPGAPNVSGAPGASARGFTPSGMNQVDAPATFNAPAPADPTNIAGSGAYAGSGMYINGAMPMNPFLNTTALLRMLGGADNATHAGPIGTSTAKYF